MRSNPTLVQAQAQVVASSAKSLQAGLNPNPVLGYASEQIGAAGTAGETQGMFFEQEIYRGGKLRLSRAKYQQEAVEAQWQVIAQQYRVLNEVRARYFDVLAANRLVNLQKELLGNYEELLRTTRELVNIGQANRPDLLQAQIQLQHRRVDVIEAENRYRKSWEFLATVLGAPGCLSGPLADTLEGDTAPIGFDAALDALFQNSPDLQAARAEVVRDEITVARERVQPRPNVFVRVDTGWNAEVGNYTAGVHLGINPPIWNRNQGTIREAEAEVTRASAEVVRLELTLRRRLAEVFSEYQTARAAVTIFRTETVPQAREVFELLRSSYRARRAPWSEVVFAERTYADMVEDYIEALRHLRHHEIEIRGYLLMGGLNEPEPPTPGGHIDAVPQPR
jgi:cobalt-zinc-cadmium efflux system outer membrane protein